MVMCFFVAFVGMSVVTMDMLAKDFNWKGKETLVLCTVGIKFNSQAWADP